MIHYIVYETIFAMAVGLSLLITKPYNGRFRQVMFACLAFVGWRYLTFATVKILGIDYLVPY